MPPNEQSKERAIQTFKGHFISLADTVFFKHKYITQPTVTPADDIVNALAKLQDAIQGIQHSKNDAHFEDLRRLEQTLQPQNKQIIKTGE
jgi:hypothetical protein